MQKFFNLNQIGLKQIECINKSKLFLKRESTENENIATDPNYFLTCWSSGVGNLNLQKISYKEVTFIKKFQHNLKEIYSKTLVRNVEIYQNNNNKKYKNLVISYCSSDDIKKNKSYFDKYFSLNISLTKDTLWFLISIGKNINLPKKNISNLIIFKRIFKSKISNLFSLAIFFLNFFISLKFLNFKRNFSKILSTSWFDEKLNDKIFDLLEKHQIRNLILPYEAQPHQHNILKNIKERKLKVYTIGYMHTSLPSLPTDYIKRDGHPDKLYVNGSDQKKILCQKLGWRSNEIKSISSMRYLKKDKKIFKGQIFFPYYIYNEEMIFKNLKNFILNLPDGYLPKLSVRNHPSMKFSKKHTKLKKMIEDFLSQNKRKFSNLKVKKNISLFIGSTSSILECLERGIEAIHICENNLFDLYHPKIWKSLQVKQIDQNVFKYKLSRKGNCIKLGSKNFNFKKFGI